MSDTPRGKHAGNVALVALDREMHSTTEARTLMFARLRVADMSDSPVSGDALARFRQSLSQVRKNPKHGTISRRGW